MHRTPWLAAAIVLFTLSPAAVAQHFPYKNHLKQPDSWFAGAEAKTIAANVLSHQSPLGSWPKNIDTGAAPYQGDPKAIRGTFDNDATIGELRFLTRMFTVTADERYREAVLKGLKHILDAQYPTGGWPQFYPPPKTYHRHITFNDNAMVNLLQLLRDMTRAKEFAFVKAEMREAADKAFGRGIECIVKCQIVVKGVPTAWCAQHDEVTLEPRLGRSYEHPSISGGESSGILLLLMSLDDPSPAVVRAVHAGCKWYEAVKVTGIRVVKKNGDRVVVKDADAPPLWARFYEIGTNRPIFSGRDGVIKYDLAEIEAERRNGYAWYGSWGNIVLERYGGWKTKHLEGK
jgi:pectate lyase